MDSKSDNSIINYDKINISKNYIENLQKYYTTILTQDITKDGKFLLATTSKLKNLAIFPLGKYLEDIRDDFNNLDIQHLSILSKLNRPKPISFLPIENYLSLNFLQQTDSQYKFLLGGQGTIKGYKLSIENIQELEEEWNLKLSNETTITNSIILMKNLLITGCNDNNIYIFDQETQKPLLKLIGHEDYIHKLKCSSNFENKSDSFILYSASEDGSIRLWDLRTPNQSISTIYPYKQDYLNRSNFGKWIGALDLSKTNNDWLVCGGGPSLSLWHLRTGKCSNKIETPGVIYDVKLLSDNSRLIAAGSDNQITIWNRADPHNSNKIDTSIDLIYSISNYYYKNLDYDLYCFAGDSYHLEICKNTKMIDFKLFIS